MDYTVKTGKVIIQTGANVAQLIQTQQDFETLLASSTWLDAESVVFDGSVVGDTGFTLTTQNNSGIQIPSTVRQIQGINGAKIVVSNFVYDATMQNGGLGGIWYATAPTEVDYYIKDLSLVCSASGTGVGYGFYNCVNIENCNSAVSGYSATYCFYQCQNLKNCSASSNASSTGSEYGFYSCENLISCNAVLGNGSGMNKYSFVDCLNLSDCVGKATATREGIGFLTCSNIVNCMASGSGGMTGVGFSSCQYCSNSGYIKVQNSSGDWVIDDTQKPSGSLWSGTNTKIDSESCDANTDGTIPGNS